MKIFSLQSKIELVIWSLLLGVIAGFLVSSFVKVPYFFRGHKTKNISTELSSFTTPHYSYGWPFQYKDNFDGSANFIAEVQYKFTITFFGYPQFLQL